MTDEPARLYGITDRGMVAEGSYADLVVLDPATVASHEVGMRYDLPGGPDRLYAESEGIEHVSSTVRRSSRTARCSPRTAGTLLRSGRDTSDSADEHLRLCARGGPWRLVLGAHRTGPGARRACVGLTRPATHRFGGRCRRRSASCLDSLERARHLVGHSYGGLVISEAAGGGDDVAQLVYVAAVLVGAEESVIDHGRRSFAPTPLMEQMEFTPDGSMIFSPQTALECFYQRDAARMSQSGLVADASDRRRRHDRDPGVRSLEIGTDHLHRVRARPCRVPGHATRSWRRRPGGSRASTPITRRSCRGPRSSTAFS